MSDRKKPGVEKRRARKRERHRVKRKATHSPHEPKLVKGGTSQAVVKFGPWITFSSNYTNGALEVLGPHVVAEWGLPAALSEHRRIRGEPERPPVVGYMLVDTGASHTCIVEEVAEELGLTHVGKGTTFGAHGEGEVKKFMARFCLRIENGGEQLAVVRDMIATGVRGLQRLYDGMGAQVATGTPMRVVGLLGRDFLRYTRTTYHGTEGKFEMSIHLPSFPRII